MELKPVERDILVELSNISMGSAATALSNLLNTVVRLVPPGIVVTTTKGFQEQFNESGILIRVDFTGGLEGVHFLFLPEGEAAYLAGLILGKGEDPSQTVDFPELDALNEAMGVMMGAYSTSLANFLGTALQLDPPLVEQINPLDKDFSTLGFTETDFWVKLDFVLETEPAGKINLQQLFPAALLQAMLAPLLQAMGIDPAAEEGTGGEGAPKSELEELSAQTEIDRGPPVPERDLPELDQLLNNMEQDTIAEVGNISLGSSATALSQLVDQRVQITTPRLKLTTMEHLREQYPLSSVIVRVNYREGLEGESILILKEEDAALIAGLMMGLPPGEAGRNVGDMEMSAVSEAMNQMMGSAATAMSNFLDRKIDISPPELNHVNLKKEMVQINQLDPGEPVLLISFQLEIGDLLQSQLIHVLPFSFVKGITSYLLQDFMTGEDEKKSPGPRDESVAAEPPAATGQAVSGDVLNEMQMDALAEVGNISLGSSATALSELINKKVSITAPRVSLTTMKEVTENYPVPCLVVMVNYVQGLDGNNILIIKKEDALVIVGLMMGMEPPEKPPELDELEVSAVSEAMNQMMGSAATAMSDFLDRVIDISPPEIIYKDLHRESLNIAYYEEDTPLIQVAFRMEVEGLIDSDLLQLVPVSFAREITSYLISTFTGEEVPALEQPVESQVVEIPGQQSADRLAEPPDEVSPKEREEFFFPAKEEQAAAESPFRELAGSLSEDEHAKLNLIRDIPLEIQAVLGRAKIPLKKIFSLSPGEIVNLHSYVGEPVEILAHGRLVAKGEVVLVSGQFGVKITEIIRPRF